MGEPSFIYIFIYFQLIQGQPKGKAVFTKKKKKMPDSKTFLQHFGLVKGQSLGLFTILMAKSTHEVLVKNAQYQYKIDLKLKCVVKNQEPSLACMVSESKIILSRFGNPYLCSHGNWKITSRTRDQSIVLVSGLGTANRIPKQKNSLAILESTQDHTKSQKEDPSR
jgi:hypothetical protein